MKDPRGLRPLALLVVVAVGFLVLSSVSAPSALASPSSSAVTGSVTGPNVLAIGGSVDIAINGTGGPAFAANGTQVGNLTYYASVEGTSLTGVGVTPAQHAITNHTAETPLLTVGSVAETLTVLVLLSSVYGHQNVSTNLTYTVVVVQPYVVSATIVNPGPSAVLGFSVVINLDGNPVGKVSVPNLGPGKEYNLSFDYATLGLSAGEHTFSISLSNEHGLVTFAGGATSFSQSFYIEGASPNYTLWYVVGGVAFVGVLFIFMTRVAARRRGAIRK